VKKQNQNIGQKGAAAVEFAIILPLLVILVFGIIDISTALYNKQVITNASREGARQGIVVGLGRSGGDAAEFRTWSEYVADDYCADHLVTFGSGDLTILTSYNDLDGDGPSRGDDLTVSITYDYVFSFFPFPTVPLHADTIMKLE